MKKFVIPVLVTSFLLGVIFTSLFSPFEDSDESRVVINTLSEFHTLLKEGNFGSLNPYLHSEVNVKTSFENVGLTRENLIERVSNYKVEQMIVIIRSCDIQGDEAKVISEEHTFVDFGERGIAEQNAERQYLLRRIDGSWKITGIEQIRLLDSPLIEVDRE